MEDKQLIEQGYKLKQTKSGTEFYIRSVRDGIRMISFDDSGRWICEWYSSEAAAEQMILVREEVDARREAERESNEGAADALEEGKAYI